ncbi:TetR/AcrR family transcriptional regulator [Paractinoplanes atraurantiacus]|uniref:DNA-binding transcriptional regulator, AcrR family n=1 Tax=Paractinoplanes atraurantiacus TaxID=1036182 RepID=A0A285IRI4_9ACTN|nr:TetR/AcrR family transcriptional regulator [Actinoplanes atraurantiacus]SNY49696.1 DNA-binding transcriptional regulator, AcrR family [Actinoplanes atraurantiacus]
MPTGVALRDVRQQLFDAADRVLRRDGAGGLTSRAVTTEAGVAKGVLHRHFTDFDDFLAALVEDRVAALPHTFEARAGTATVVTNVAGALTEIFSPVALHIVALIIARDELRARLRRHRPTGIPLLTEAATLLATYLKAEQDEGRLSPQADADTLALTLIGTSHLVFAGHEDTPPDPAEVEKLVTSVLAGAA